MNHEMKVDPDPFNRIKMGTKVIEVRLFDDKRKKINIGDTITFFRLPDLDRSIKTKVIGLSRFDDFETLFSVFGPKYFNHNKDLSIKEQVLGMRGAYSEEKEKQFKVLGIHIKCLP